MYAKSILAVVSVVAASLSAINAGPVLSSDQTPFMTSQDSDIIPGEFLVMFDESAVLEKNVDALINELMQLEKADTDALLYRYSTGFAAKLSQEHLDLIRSRSEVEFVEPNSVVSIHETQQNPPSWGLPRINQRSFRVSDRYLYPDTAGDNVDVYVIDTGVFIMHEDFEGRAKWGYTAIPGGSDEDGNGHGTHVASTIAGKKYGVAKKANIIAVRVLNSYGSGTMAGVVDGVEWSAKQVQASGKPSVANMSLGGGRSPSLDRAVGKAVEAGLNMAVAAGNSNTDACRSSPAASEQAVTVGATSKDDSRAFFSNYGKCVDIFAPGHGITGAWIGTTSSSRTISGTSMASPHVAGVMSLFLSEQVYSPTELKEKLAQVAFEGILTGIPADTVNLLLNNNYGEQIYF